MRFFKFAILLFAIVFKSIQFSFAQVSHPSGFYSGVDSLLFEVLWEVEDFENIQISVNHSNYIDYTGGVLLKDLSYSDNDWENAHLYRGDKYGGAKVIFNREGITNLRVDGKNEGNFELFVNVEVLSDSQKKMKFAVNIFINSNLAYSKEHTINRKNNLVLNSNMGWNLICDDYSQLKVGDKWDIYFNANRQYNYPIDYNVERGKIRKVNTVKVRSVDTHNGEIIRDSIYIIGLFEYPYEHHTLIVTTNDKDVIRVLNDYGDVSKKRDGYIHIFSPKGEIEYQGHIKLKKAAGSSKFLPNHGMSFKAVKKEYISTSLFDDKSEDIDKIKFRVGGSDQSQGFSCHEIALNILSQTPKLKMIGGVKNSIAVFYLNGSYWSMGFPQQKANKFFYKNLLDVESSVVDVFGVIPFVFKVDSIVEKVVNGVKGTIIYPNMEFQKRYDVESEIFVHKKKDKFILVKNTDDSEIRVEGILKDGDAQRVSNKIKQYKSKEISLEELIDVDLWSMYLAMIHFGNMRDVVSHNNNIGIIDGGLLFPILLDFDNFGKSSIFDNNFDAIFGDYISGEQNLFKSIIRDFRNSEFAINRFYLVYQELLNTSLDPKNTVSIVQKYESEVMKLYDEMYHSWGGYPNGGIEPQKQRELFGTLKEFYEKRPEKCLEFLNEFMTKKVQNPSVVIDHTN